MSSTIIDGKKLAHSIKEHIKKEVAGMKQKPGLAVLLVGDNPASKIYVAAKERACQEVGFYSRKVLLPADATEGEVLSEIQKLNTDEKIHGFIVQMPIPKHISEKNIVDAISEAKDVDCFKEVNIGRMFLARRRIDFSEMLLPCTPKGAIKLIESTSVSIEGKHAVVLGRSNIVGKPVATLLLNRGATVTVCHSKTTELATITKQADILIAAIGMPRFVTATMVKTGAVVIDIGINRGDDAKVCGDVDFEEVKETAGYITPVPGGAGPMTIACLLENTLLLAKKQYGTF